MKKLVGVVAIIAALSLVTVSCSNGSSGDSTSSDKKTENTNTSGTTTGGTTSGTTTGGTTTGGTTGGTTTGGTTTGGTTTGGTTGGTTTGGTTTGGTTGGTTTGGTTTGGTTTGGTTATVEKYTIKIPADESGTNYTTLENVSKAMWDEFVKDTGCKADYYTEANGVITFKTTQDVGNWLGTNEAKIKSFVQKAMMGGTTGGTTTGGTTGGTTTGGTTTGGTTGGTTTTSIVDATTYSVVMSGNSTSMTGTQIKLMITTYGWVEGTDYTVEGTTVTVTQSGMLKMQSAGGQTSGGTTSDHTGGNTGNTTTGNTVTYEFWYNNQKINSEVVPAGTDYETIGTQRGFVKGTDYTLDGNKVMLTEVGYQKMISMMGSHTGGTTGDHTGNTTTGNTVTYEFWYNNQVIYSEQVPAGTDFEAIGTQRGFVKGTDYTLDGTKIMLTETGVQKMSSQGALTHSH